MEPASQTRNRILRLLGEREFARLWKDLEPVELSFKEEIYHPKERIRHLYFLNTGVVSVITEVRRGRSLETETVGREGVAGLAAFLGMPSAPGRVFCQVPGDALRIEVGALHRAVARRGLLGLILLRYTHAVMSMLSQGAACLAAHSVEQRMARWLLTTQDRVDSDRFVITQEFLGLMLGISRSSVSITGRGLQRSRLICYSRGQMTILDRAGLEAATCECYHVVRQHLHTSLEGGKRSLSAATLTHGVARVSG